MPTLLAIDAWLIVAPPVAPPATGSLWTSADLLARCKRHARRPVTDQTMPDLDWYAFLTEAQTETFPDLFTRYPAAGVSDPQPMVSSDNGATYTFGYDAANENARVMGHVELYGTLGSIPDDPLVEGEDFLAEGDLIRIPQNRTRTFDGGAGPYARLILTPDIPISSAYEPLLFPKPNRMLLVWKALERWAARAGSGADPTYYAGQYELALRRAWTGYATTFNMHPTTIRARWYTGLDLGRRAGLA